METLNIAPTWVWVMSVALALIDDKTASKKARDGFVDEVCRLGDDVKTLIEEYKRGNFKTRTQIRVQLIDKARRIDAFNEKKGVEK